MKEDGRTIDPRAIVSAYAPAGRLARAYVRVKLLICPLISLEKLVPRAGRIAELGCGIGVLTKVLAAGSGERQIDAIDLSETKIKAAAKTLRGGEKVTFSAGDIRAFAGTGYDSIVISDTLYLLEERDQEAVLKRCHAALKPGGTLVVKEMDREPALKFLVNLLQETLAVRIVRFTRGAGLHFRGAGEYLRLLASLGFDVRCVRLDARYPYPHVAYVCEKRPA